MEEPIVTIVFAPSPLLGRSPFSTSGFGSGKKREKYLNTLKNEIDKHKIKWLAKIDDTESDIEIISQEASLIVCTPGLKYQFYAKGFDKKNIIHLTTMQYETFDTSVVIHKIKELSL